MLRTPVTLSRALRTQLESTVKAARIAAEKGARGALDQLAVTEANVPDYLTDERKKALRRRLRTHGRALGDVKAKDDTQDVQHLVWEVAYEHWHRMLFARFLAENGLLMWEPGAPVSLDDCRDMVDNHPDMALGAKSHWELASKLAARMLPQVFKPQSPVFEVAFAPEFQRELERLLAALPREVFQASDSLGWVYQFWQAKRKDEVNASEVKIGADELPAVTQLFTEPYMVDFLLHNSLGAWWVTRYPDKSCAVPLTFLRTLDDGTPAAGKFESWPDALVEFQLLDPCCGSGHFLVAAFLMLVPMRMAAEGLNAMQAVDSVLADNLHGLELDARCVEIAVFALALAAWRFPDENGNPLGVRADMPAPKIACCGLNVTAKPEDWMALVSEDAPNATLLRQELSLLHTSFAQAPLLGSLLDPAYSLKNDLATSNFDTLRELLEHALASERPNTVGGMTGEMHDDAWELVFTAHGLLEAAKLLEGRYHLVVTNVPFQTAKNLAPAIKNFFLLRYEEAKANLATVMTMRCIELAQQDGYVAVVSPQTWMALKGYEPFRRKILSSNSIRLVARLGDKAFQSPGSNGEQISLTFLQARNSGDADFHVIDASTCESPESKAKGLQVNELKMLNSAVQLKNPQAIILIESRTNCIILGSVVTALPGVSTSDSPRFIRKIWEVSTVFDGRDWEYQQTTTASSTLFSGMENAIYWQKEVGALASLAESVKHLNHGAQNWRRGKPNWGKLGIVVSQMGTLEASLYCGHIYDNNCTAIVPTEQHLAPAIWCYVQDGTLRESVRALNQKRSVEAGTFLAAEFNAEYWQAVASERYPDGLPKPYSDDPTQWVFHGHPQPSTDPLQVAVARLAGYRWPAETDMSMELADEARIWIDRCDQLDEHTDDDGIVCLPSVRGEPPAHERLLKLLIAAWETVQPGSWRPGVLDKLLTDVECAGKGLDVWLRDRFFEQHAKRFVHRPFIWHVWDGVKDGFSALVNYHKLDAKNLERLIHTYLGDWIRQQEAGARDRVDGAQARLAAAQDLKRRLELILEGEKPYDIFVRWKSLTDQPMGWNPDLNDGVRLNIRPFMTAEVLRHNKKPKLNVTWDKDRGKDVESAPWFKVFGGERINEHHLTLVDKKPTGPVA